MTGWIKTKACRGPYVASWRSSCRTISSWDDRLGLWNRVFHSWYGNDEAAMRRATERELQHDAFVIVGLSTLGLINMVWGYVMNEKSEIIYLLTGVKSIRQRVVLNIHLQLYRSNGVYPVYAMLGGHAGNIRIEENGCSPGFRIWSNLSNGRAVSEVLLRSTLLGETVNTTNLRNDGYCLWKVLLDREITLVW